MGGCFPTNTLCIFSFQSCIIYYINSTSGREEVPHTNSPWQHSRVNCILCGGPPMPSFGVCAKQTVRSHQWWVLY